MSTTNTNLRSKSQTQKPDKLINLQRREKLKNLLITKFMKKYGIKDPELILQQEISKFMLGDQLTDTDLKRLDDKIKSILIKRNEEESLKQNLSKEPQIHSISSSNKLILPEIDNHRLENMSVKSKHSKMSGISHLSKYSEHKKRETIPEDERLSQPSQTNRAERVDFNNEGDEWNAIAKFNQKMFYEEKIMTQYKDKEIKKRTKAELDSQVKDKLRKVNDEYKKNKEYDNILIEHCDFLSKVERSKLDVVKNKTFKEKENRDLQLNDEKKRKKSVQKKERQFDKELGK